MFFKNPRRILSEAAAADMLNPEVSEEVKDVIDQMEDVLSNNIEEVDDNDKTTNGGIPTVSESVSLMESCTSYGRAKYLVTLESVIAIKETEGEKTAEAMQEPGSTPSEEECENCEPDAVNVVEDIAAKNGVDPEQVAIVISSENVRFLAATALLEQKACRSEEEAKGTKRLKKVKDTVKELIGKVKIVKT